MDITNTGGVAGAVVAQLYVPYDSAEIDRPLKELKGFARVHLQPGETKRAAFTLAARSLAYHEERRAD